MLTSMAARWHFNHQQTHPFNGKPSWPRYLRRWCGRTAIRMPNEMPSSCSALARHAPSYQKQQWSSRSWPGPVAQYLSQAKVHLPHWLQVSLPGAVSHVRSLLAMGGAKFWLVELAAENYCYLTMQRNQGSEASHIFSSKVGLPNSLQILFIYSM